MYSFYMGFFLPECVDIYTQHIYSLFFSFINNILFIITTFSWNTFFISAFSLYFLTCLYFSCKTKKLHFVSFLFFIKFLFTNLVLLFITATTLYIFSFLELYTYIDSIPKDIYYNIILFLLISFTLGLDFKSYNILSFFIRATIFLILRVTLIYYFPDLESYLYFNLLFLLFPDLIDIIKELGNFVFMDNGYSNNLPNNPMGNNNPMNNNNPMGNNNGQYKPIIPKGDSSQNTLGKPYNNEVNEDDEKYGPDPFAIPEDSVKRYSILHWIKIIGLDINKDFKGFKAGDHPTKHKADVISNTIKPFYLPQKYVYLKNSFILVEVYGSVILTKADNLRNLLLTEHSTFTVYSELPEESSENPNWEFEVRVPNGITKSIKLKREGHFNMRSITFNRVQEHTKISVELPKFKNQKYFKYEPHNMMHWGKPLFLMINPAPKYLGAAPHFFDPSKDGVIQGVHLIPRADVYKYSPTNVPKDFLENYPKSEGVVILSKDSFF